MMRMLSSKLKRSQDVSTLASSNLTEQLLRQQCNESAMKMNVSKVNVSAADVWQVRPLSTHSGHF